MKNKIGLTKADWEEIENALHTKLNLIENGDLGGESHLSSPNGCEPQCEACENEKWSLHIKEILKKIENGANL